jgi:hypothetical protein
MGLSKGSTRTVLVCGPRVLKIARDAYGARCNLFEAELYRRTTAERRKMLCPVIAGSRKGHVLVMRALVILTPAEFAIERAAGRIPDYGDWDYCGPGDDDFPFERHKADDWGWLDGRPVAVDYANSVREWP